MSTPLYSQQASTTLNNSDMKMNAGIITEKLAETKKFYQEKLGFGITFENEWFILMHTPDHKAEISFLLPNHPSQQPIFQKPFQGQGVYLTFEVEHVDVFYKEIQEKQVPIAIELREEPWGDRHFAIVDPNGIGIDFVKYSAPEQDGEVTK
ncbi:MAG: VOC family protein [Candidatus Cyclobacteriaceae bacterium M3_2C_046]